MASRGSFATTGYQGRHLVLSWETVSVDIANNTTTISWSVKGAGNAQSSWYQSGNFTFIIDGETVYRSTQTVHLYNGTVVASGKKTLTHDDAGSRSFTASVSAGIYNYGGTNATGNGTWSLDPIPRYATLTSSPNFNDEQNPTIYYSNPAGDAVERVIAVISLDGSKNDVYREIPKTGDSYTFVLVESEREILRNATQGSNSRTVYFYLGTDIAGQRHWEYQARTYTVVNTTPTIDPVVWDKNPDTVKFTGNSGKLIRYRSKGAYQFNAKAYKGASIASYRMANGAVVEEGHAAGWVDFVQNEDFAFTVVDTRGNTATKILTTDCIPYVVPSVSFGKFELDTAGALRFSARGNLYSGSFGLVNNDANLLYRFKEQGGTYGQWIKFSSNTPTDTNNYYSVDGSITGLDYLKTYVVQLAVEDSFVFVTSEERVVVSKPIFDWGEHDFNFNVPVKIGGVELDYVVAQGTSGIWTWRKWNSGLGECWGTAEISDSFDHTWGNWYYGGSMQRIPYPFVFSGAYKPPKEFVNPNGPISLTHCTEYSNTRENTGTYFSARPTSMGYNTIYYDLYVVGRWR